MGLFRKLIPTRRRDEPGRSDGPDEVAQSAPVPSAPPAYGTYAPPRDSSLCKKCADVFSKVSFRATTDASTHQISFVPPKPWKWSKRDLETGSSNGCIFCPKLQTITGGGSSISMEAIEPGIPRLSQATENDISVEGYWTICVSAAGKKSYLSLFPITEDECSTCVNYYPNENTGGAASVALVKQWIDRCLREHPSCAKNTAPDTYPTRLLEIIGTEIRLVETEDGAVTGPYVALSHCWGKNPSNLLLTTDNEQTLQAGIPRADLPLTFREAVDVTDRLGFRYIWIDSLCIIQAGPRKVADWTREVRLMAAVYSNSVLNLAASDSAHSGAGMFRNRSINEARPVMMTFPTPVSRRDGSLRWAVTAPARPHVLVTPGVLEHGVGHFPLDQRAWVCQERLLAPRKAHFAKSQVFWECAEMPLACESLACGIDGNHTLVQTRSSIWAIAAADAAAESAQDQQPEASSGNVGSLTDGLLQVYADPKTKAASVLSTAPASPQDRALGDLSASAAPLLATPPVTWQAGDRVAQSERWFDTLTDFTRRQLTVPSDKLPAIGAVAQKVGASLGEEYVLGCFKSHLPQALLWQYRDGPIKTEPKTASATSFVAPSWSWASTTHPLTFTECYWPALVRSGADMKLHIFPTVLEVKAALVDSQNPFGQVTSGHILLRAPIAPLAQATGMQVAGGKVTLEAGCLASRYQTVSFDEQGSRERVGANVCLLPVGWRTGHGRVGGTPFMREYGLGLVQNADASYSRVGTFLGTHMSPGSKTAEWRYGTQDWGYPENMIRDVKIV